MLKAIVAGSAIALSSCGILTKSYTFYFKMTLTALFNGDEHIGSTIIKGRWVDTLGVGDVSERWVGHFTGDAIFIDLGSRRALIGLLGPVGNQPAAFGISNGLLLSIARSIAPASVAGAGDGSQVFEALKGFRGEQEMPKKNYPVMAYLEDVDDIQSAQIVYPEPENAFGPTVGVSGFSLALTDGPASSGLAGRLPWYRFLGTFPPAPAHEQTHNTAPAYQMIMPPNIHEGG
jgi:hypothetical protein